MKASQIFTPGAFPSHTYVERNESGKALETFLRDSIDTSGQITSIVGPSKSGKTVLVEKVVGKDLLIPITGAGITSPEVMWDRVLDKIGAPTTKAQSQTTGETAKISSGISGDLGAFGSKVGTRVDSGNDRKNEQAVSTVKTRSGLAQIEAEIANSEYALLIDDFHYMPREVQVETAKALKEAARLGVKIITASVVHRGDDVVRALPELRGRLTAVDIKYWTPEDLKKIAHAGFNALNVDVDPNLILKLVQEAAGSPQLMQRLCLQTCFVYGIRERKPSREAIRLVDEKIKDVLIQTSTATDFRSLVDVLHAGPRTRGTERKIYKFRDGTEGDVYRCILKAVAADPSRLSFAYDDLLRRTAAVCVAGGDSPVGSSVSGTCSQMSKLALDKFPADRAIDWDDQKAILDIPDPYFLFYLRWSGRLIEPDE